MLQYGLERRENGKRSREGELKDHMEGGITKLVCVCVREWGDFHLYLFMCSVFYRLYIVFYV